VTLEEGLELIANYKKALEKFLETLPEQSVQLGSEMIKTLSMNSKNEIANLDSIEKALKRQPKYQSGLSE
jgi:ABC-type transporter Mla subunit MlaD